MSQIKLAFIYIIAFSLLASAAEASKTRVAFISGKTGSDPHTARELERGVDVFLQQNPDAAKKLGIERFDSKGDPAETFKAIESIAKKGIKLVVGIARSDEAIVISKYISDKDMLFLTPFATNPRVTQESENAFQICFSDLAQGPALAAFAGKLYRGKKLLVLTNTSSLYSIGLTEGFMKNLPKDVSVKQQLYSTEARRGDVIQALVRDFKPAAIFIPDHINNAALFANEIHREYPEIEFLGGDGFGGLRVLKGVFGETPSIQLTFSTHWHESVKTPANERFLAGYRKLYPGDLPTSGAALTFDSLNVLYQALKKAKYSDEAKRLRELIVGGTFHSTTGDLRFRNGERSAIKDVVLLKYDKGVVSPVKSQR